MTENRKVNFRLGKPSSQRKVSYQPIDKVEEDSVHDGDKVLYPLDDLFQEFIKQEQVMWKKTQGVHIPLEESDYFYTEGVEEEVLSVGGRSPSIHSSVFNPDSSHYLIRYGQLTKVIHKHFRKLEKEHACLYLSGRRANFENLRLHHTPRPTNVAPQSPEPDNQVSSARGTELRVHSLRDEELFVYRCTLMSAQYPMLSAPSPPDDHSPSPPLPTLLLAQTAPSESSAAMAYLSPSKLAEKVAEVHNSTDPSVQSDSTLIQDSTSVDSVSVPNTKDPNQDDLDKVSVTEQKLPPIHPRPKISRVSSGGRKNKSHKGDEFEGEGGKGGVKERSKKSSLKREKRDGRSNIDSDDDDEVLRLCETRGSNCLDPLGWDQPFPPMVNREMLCTLARRSFYQTEEQQIQFEQILRHDYGRKSKGEILARELVSQLQVLENNAHPFYKPRNFVTRNGYEIWLQGEKQRIRDMLDKFWHYQLPKPQAWSHNSSDYHKAYIVLLEKIICSESRSPRREPVHGGRTPSAPLSATAQRLLTEFGLRYGIGELFRQISYLDYLAKHFDYEVWYIRHCTEQLRLIRCLLPRNRSRTIATRKEMDTLRNTVHLLHGQTDNSLTRIDRLFQDSDPQIGVASLIDLLKEVLDAEQSLFNQRVRSIDEWLKKYLKGGFVLRYERRKEIVSDEILEGSTITPFQLSPILVNSLLLSIREEVAEYKETYQTVFRRYFNIVPFAKVEFYRLLCSDACSLCARAIHSPESRQKLNLEMLGLLYRLNDRDMEWSNVIPTEMQQWRNQFVHLALIWMDVLAKQINQWITLAIQDDQWTLLTFTTHSSSLSEGDDRSSSQMTAVQSSVHVSPFPTSLSGFPLSLPSTLVTHADSAFTPVSNDRGRLFSPMSETSGGITELSSSNTSYESLSVENHSLLRNSSKTSKKDRSSNDTVLNFSKGGAFSRIHKPTDSLLPDTPSPILPGTDSDDLTPHRTPVQEISPTARPEQIGFTIEAIVHEDEERVPEEKKEPHENSLIDNPSDKIEVSHQHVSENQGSIVDEGLAQETLEKVSENTETSPIKNEGSLPETLDRVKSEPESFDPEKTLVPSEPVNTKDPSSDGQSLSSSSPSPSPTTPVIHHEVTYHSPIRSGANPPPPQDLEDTSEDEVVSKRQTKPEVDFNSPSLSNPSRFTDNPPKLPSKPPKISLVSELSSPNTLYSPFDTSPNQTRTHSRNQWESGYQKPGTKTHTNYTHQQSVEDAIVELDQSESPAILPISPLSSISTSYFLPLSNSPFDMITMYTRLASFIGVLINTLTPKIQHGFHSMGVGSSLEVPSEVTQVRRLMADIQQQAENMRIEFLKKLHKTMVNSIKLYADNLLCMDLCCWPQGDAAELLGEEMVHHLRRRRDTGEIWGCRHVVEANNGLYPNGIPCQKKTKLGFESITRDMCIRINNVHMLITVFPSLESHLYSITLSPSSQTPFGVTALLTSEATESGKLNGISPKIQTKRPFPHRYRPERHQQPHILELLPTDVDAPTTGSDTGTASTGLGMTPLSRRKVETGFQSTEAHQLLEYLNNIQQCQLQMICTRMNQFFKPALSFLLDLKLGNCSLSRRLHSLVTFLTRHCTALQKYLYPECFDTLMEYLWKCILQDVEEEALKLRKLKKRAVGRATLLLQTINHLITVMHNKGTGLSLEILTSSTEYLLALLDVFLQPTERLTRAFNRLCAPHFTHNQVSLDQSPVPIEPNVIHELSNRLHTFKKCFTGSEFVHALVEIGQTVEEKGTDSTTSGEYQDTPTDRPVVYSITYATRLGNYLLSQDILICLYSSNVDLDPTSTEGLESASCERLKAMNTTQHGDMKITIPDEIRSTSTSAFSSTSSYSTGGTPSIEPVRFHNSPHCYYRFTDIEDNTTGSFFQRAQILSSCIRTPRRLDGRVQVSEFEQARFGTLFLILDVCHMRSNKDNEAKRFLQLHNVIMISEQRTGNNISCHKIFRV